MFEAGDKVRLKRDIGLFKKGEEFTLYRVIGEPLYKPEAFAYIAKDGVWFFCKNLEKVSSFSRGEWVLCRDRGQDWTACKFLCYNEVGKPIAQPEHSQSTFFTFDEIKEYQATYELDIDGQGWIINQEEYDYLIHWLESRLTKED